MILLDSYKAKVIRKAQIQMIITLYKLWLFINHLFYYGAFRWMDLIMLTPKLFQLSSPYMLKSNISLSPGEIANKASNILPQYRVQSVAFVKQTDLSNLSVEIKMRRIIWYHVTNTFIPTTR